MELTAEAVIRLTGQALGSFLGHAPRFEMRAAKGVWMTLCGEPVTDLNYILVSSGSPEARSSFEASVGRCDDLALPFVAMIAPEAVEGLAPARENQGLAHVVDWPLMTCSDLTGIADPSSDLEIAPASSPEDLRENATVLARSFGMPEDSVGRVVTPGTARLPGLTIHLARRAGTAVSTVTVTRHGPVAGIWAMGTAPEAQGKGIGKALLSTVMLRERDRGAEVFFLGATPAGKPLYDRLGFRTVSTLEAWVRGETGEK